MGPRTRAPRQIADLGLAAVIWIALAAVLQPQHGSVELLSVSVAAALWVVCLKACRRAIPLIFGPTCAAVAGAALALLPVAALRPWLFPVDEPGVLTLLELAGAVLVTTAMWWAIVDRTGAVRRVMIVGTDSDADSLAAELARAADGHIEVVGVVDASAEPSGGVDDVGMREFAQVLRAQQPDLVVVADDRCCDAAIGPMLDLGDDGLRVVGVVGLFEHVLGCVPVGHLSPTWFMSLLHLRQRPYSAIAKRLFDVIGTAVALVLASPLLAIVALAVWRRGEPILYRQTRVGQGGRLFEMVKFRTMRQEAETEGCPCWAAVDDSRTTRVGRVLRRTHLDELPQLWNVLRGDMSIVGPRPERPGFIEQLEESVPYWGRRLLIKPGLTGWAQIRSGYAADLDAAASKLSYDLWYLRHRSLLLDFAICLRTLPSLLYGPGRGR